MCLSVCRYNRIYSGVSPSIIEEIEERITSWNGSASNQSAKKSFLDEDKKNQEIGSLKAINDSFKKIVIINDVFKPWNDDTGILYLPLKEFLLNDNSIDL